MESAPTVNDNAPKKDISVQKWISRINKARKKEQKWRERAKEYFAIYRNDDNGDSQTQTDSRLGDDGITFNIFAANVDTLQPALFSTPPKPDIRPRYSNKDPAAKIAAQIIEKVLVYEMDSNHFVREMKDIVKDYLITGRGTPRERAVPVKEDKPFPVLDKTGMPQLDETGQPVMQMHEITSSYKAVTELVPWDMVTFEPVKRWTDVTWISFQHDLSLADYRKFFGNDVPLPPISGKGEDEEAPESGFEDPLYKIEEVWDKNEKEVIFLAKGMDKPILTIPDPLKLTNFFPMPKPIYSISTSGTLVPVPEYSIYKNLANDLDTVSYRLARLTDVCRFRGIYDESEENIKQILTTQDSQMIGVSANRLKDGGMQGLMAFMDISMLAGVIAELSKRIEQMKSHIYEVTGISDIIRGESVASETATAQSIKASYAGLRLRDRKDEISRFVAELLNIKTEIICEFFPTEQLQEISGEQITPEIEQLLKNDMIRNYRVDIETDSLILSDSQSQLQQRAQIISSVVDYLKNIIPFVAQGAIPLETAKALLNYGLKPANISAELEDALDLIGQRQAPPTPQGMPGAPQMMTGGMPPNGAPSANSLPPEILAALHGQVAQQ